jgi:hypothetical protein
LALFLASVFACVVCSDAGDVGSFECESCGSCELTIRVSRVLFSVYGSSGGVNHYDLSLSEFYEFEDG